jgi:ferredoxin
VPVCRTIIKIDEEKCTGCGDCIPNCPEGALLIIDGKARLVSDLFCDGLGACIGHCPEGAITVEEREAEPYDEDKVMANIVPQGPNTIAAHLKHLRDHGAVEYHNRAVEYLRQHNIPVPTDEPEACLACGCPGSVVQEIEPPTESTDTVTATGPRPSCLRNWPVQIKLVPIDAPYLKNADLLIAADCVTAACPDFHERFVRNRILLIGCPKFDDADHYRDKLADMFRRNAPNSVTCVRMTVPCCSGLVRLVRDAIAASGRTIPFAEAVIHIDGHPVESPE